MVPAFIPTIILLLMLGLTSPTLIQLLPVKNLPIIAKSAQTDLKVTIPTPTPTPIPTPTITPKPFKITPKPTVLVPTLTPTPPPIVINNAPPAGGYSRQQVQTEAGVFSVDIVSADLSSTRVVVDTASASDCGNNCPVLSVGDYAARSGAYAGVNGAFFCPPEYPACAGKTNSFDTLLMNKNKVYFNSANNVYSVIPAFISLGNSVRFVTQSLEWGRDTSVDAVIANYPLLVLNGQIVYGSSSDGKFTAAAPRGFIANKGSTIYIGVIRSATMDQAAKVLKALGVDNALNLDDGGSAALWYNGGYVYGPGRALPNAVLFLRK